MALTRSWVVRLTGGTGLLGNKPVLQRAVKMRSPYVDALSLLQLRALRALRSDAEAGAPVDPGAAAPAAAVGERGRGGPAEHRLTRASRGPSARARGYRGRMKARSVASDSPVTAPPVTAETCPECGSLDVRAFEPRWFAVDVERERAAVVGLRLGGAHRIRMPRMRRRLGLTARQSTGRSSACRASPRP